MTTLQEKVANAEPIEFAPDVQKAVLHLEYAMFPLRESLASLPDTHPLQGPPRAIRPRGNHPRDLVAGHG